MEESRGIIMRLWSQELIPLLNRQHILAQWREVIAMLGNGWGKKHSTIEYAFNYPESYLVAYGSIVFAEMVRRGYHPNKDLFRVALMERRNKSQEEFRNIIIEAEKIAIENLQNNTNIYPEHNEEYLEECIKLLIKKGYSVDFYKQ